MTNFVETISLNLTLLERSRRELVLLSVHILTPCILLLNCYIVKMVVCSSCLLTLTPLSGVHEDKGRIYAAAYSQLYHCILSVAIYVISKFQLNLEKDLHVSTYTCENMKEQSKWIQGRRWLFQSGGAYSGIISASYSINRGFMP